MYDSIDVITAALSGTWGSPYIGSVPTDVPSVDHWVITPIHTRTAQEADDARFFDVDTTEIDLFSSAASVRELWSAAITALEAAGLAIIDRSYAGFDPQLRQHQYSIIVQDAYVVVD
jgi:hypothetical protein